MSRRAKPNQMKLPLRTLAAGALALGTLATAEAQIGIGLRGGILTTSASFDDDETTTEVLEEENVTGYTIGIPIEIAVSNVFSLQPEINFQRRGTSVINRFDSDDGQPLSQSIDRDINFLEIPFLVKLGYTTESFTVAAVAGPSWSYALGGTTTAGNVVDNTESIFGDPVEGEYDIDFDEEGYNRSQWGGHVGLQGGIPAGPGKIILDARYQFAFTDINEADDNVDLDYSDADTYNTRERGFSATLGYMLTLGDY